MRKKEEIEAYVEGLVLPITEELAFELVDVEYVKEGSSYYVRAYIDKEGGIAVDDCETVSRRLEVFLDRDDCIEGSYILEVSSPGLGRPLKKEKDYARALGKEIEVKLFRAENGTKEFCGTLTAYDNKTITLTPEAGEAMVIGRDNLALIREALDL